MKRYIITDGGSNCLIHSGRLGQKWGVRRGPPYPLDQKAIAGSQHAVGGRKTNPRKTDRNGEYKETGKDTTFRLKNKATSREEDLGVVNPDRFKQNFSFMNCTCCATAYDLRRRGYDVTATDLFPEGVTETELNKFYHGMDSSKCYFHKRQEDAPEKPSARNSRAIEKWMRKEILNQGYGARGMILLDSEMWSHAFNYENVRGTVRLLDAQTNNEYTLKGASNLAINAAVVRLDDKEPNYRYLKEKGVVRDA